jgi:hypothetical protein
MLFIIVCVCVCACQLHLIILLLLLCMCRYIGTALAQVESKSLVNATLESLEKKVAHDNETSRDGFAQALGFTSNRHLDSVLPRLASMLAVKEKKGGFFGLGSEKVGPTTQVQCTAMLCYGYVVKHADAGQILSRIEVNVMGQLLPVLASAQAGSIKTSVLKSTNLIAKALQPTRLPDGKQDFILESRDKLYKGILNVMTPDSKVNGKSAPSNEHILSGLLALQLLMSLNPALGDGLKDLTLTLVLGYYRTATGIATPREKSTSVDKKQASPAKQKKKADSSAHEITEEYKEQLTTGINDILITMVRTEPTVEALCDVLDKLLPWTKSKHLAIRRYEHAYVCVYIRRVYMPLIFISLVYLFICSLFLFYTPHYTTLHLQPFFSNLPPPSHRLREEAEEGRNTANGDAVPFYWQVHRGHATPLRR